MSTAARQTVLINGAPTIVNGDNWQTLARLKIDETRAQNPNSPPAEQLAIYRAFKQLGGVADPFAQQAPDGGVIFNTFGAQKVLDNPFVKAADYAESIQRATIGQNAVNALHIVSGQAVNAGGRIKSFLTTDLPAKAKSAAQSIRDAFDVAGTAAKWAVVGAVAVALVVIVIEVKNK